MSEEQLKAFLEKVKADTRLQEKLKAAKSSEDIVTIGKEYGHEFTAANLSQLSEEELEGVAGGISCFAKGGAGGVASWNAISKENACPTDTDCIGFV